MSPTKFAATILVLIPLLAGCDHESSPAVKAAPIAKANTVVGTWGTDRKFAYRGSESYTFEEKGTFKQGFTSERKNGTKYSRTEIGSYDLKAGGGSAAPSNLTLNVKQATDVDWNGKVTHLKPGRVTGMLLWHDSDHFTVIFDSKSADTFDFTRQQ